jgi:uncharacterized protein involved in response to NO
MDEAALIASLNAYLTTEDSMPITAQSSFFQSALRDSIFLHNQSQADLLVQAYIGRYFLRSGERVVVSLANKRVNRREMYPEIRNTLSEMMILVAMATLAYVLVKMDS